MARDREPITVRPDDSGGAVAWLQEIVRQARLAWRLFRDERVPVWTKVIPPVALAYVLFPLDIIPDWAPGLGQLDDIAVLLIGVKLFIELAPREVVREHLADLGARVREWRVVDEEPRQGVVIDEPGKGVVVEGELGAGEIGSHPTEEA